MRMDWTAAARILPLTALLVASVSQRASEKQRSQQTVCTRGAAQPARNREPAAGAGRGQIRRIPIVPRAPDV
jgi:hypothetical protein